MAGMYGADVAQLRALAQQFERTAEQLEHDRMAVGNAIQISAWVGPVAVRFRAEWDSQHSQRIVGAARLLRDNARLARANADAQEATSAIDGSSGGGPAGSGGGGGGPLSWFGDRLGELKDAGSTAVDWVGDRASDLWEAGEDAANWVGDQAVAAWNWTSGTAVAAANWTSDRAVDAWNWAGDRFEAIGDDWANYGDAAGQYWQATGGSLLDGRWPRTTEVVASTAMLTGAFAGAVVTTITAGTIEANIFDDGKPVASEPRPVNQGVTNPTSLADLTTSVTDAYDAGDGVVRVTTIDTPDGPKVIVSVPGTQSWGPETGANPMDLTGNLVTAGGGRSTMSEAVELALAKANIPAGAELMLVGHSQGGMTVADLASDRDLVTKYNVTNAITFGSPIDSTHIDPRVNVLELQHATDLVPRLDLGDALYVQGVPVGLPSGYQQSGPQHTTVTLANPSGVLDLAGNHSHENYSTSLESSADPALLAFQSQLREAGFLSGNSTNTTAQDITVGRSD
ncbi:MAG: hypothetical protein IPL43_12205 [Micropruina sp.]|nr:hypothetical protein [Micropruina sp.]